VSDWGDIVKATERFAPVGRRHGLQLVTAVVPGPDERGPLLSVELHSDDLRLVLHRYLPVVDGAAWIDALHGVLDVGIGELPHPGRWPEMTDALLEHRGALEALPVLEDDRR
jgi:hypothetical protein